MTNEDVNVLVVVGLVLLGVWCFSQGPCMAWWRQAQATPPPAQPVTGPLIIPSTGFGVC